MVYLIIQIISENPLLGKSNLSLNEENFLKLSQLFFEELEANGEKSILCTMVQQAIVDFSQSLYYYNHKDQNKLAEVFDSSVFNEVYMDYLAELEEETLKTWDEKEQERLKYSKHVNDLKAELARKEQRIKELENQLKEYRKTAEPFSLKDYRVLVIGDSRHKEGYREIIENYNGDFVFLDAGEEYHLVSEKASTADLVFHITAYGSHCVHFQLKKFKNIIHVNNAGLESLKHAFRKQFASTNQCNYCNF